MLRSTTTALIVVLLVALTALPAASRSPAVDDSAGGFVAPALRAYRSAVVVLAAPGQDVGQVQALVRLADELSAVFPTHWMTATHGLSSMEMTPAEVVLDEGFFLGDPQRGLEVDRALRSFYARHTDSFDFLTYFRIMPPGFAGLPPGAECVCANHLQVHTDQSGAGLAQPGHDKRLGKSWAVSLPNGVSRLLGINLMSVPVAFSQRPKSDFIHVMLHEYHHQWCCNMAAPPGYGIDERGLVDDTQHWKPTLLVPPSPVYPILGGPAGRGGWTENADGTFTPSCGRSEPPYSFTRLGLYAMGLIPADDVAPVEILVPTVVPPNPCAPIRANKVRIPIAAIVASNGYSARLPVPGRDVPAPAVRPGFHSRWYAQGPYLTLASGEKRWAWVAFQNTGSSQWKRGSASELRLGINGDDRTISGAGISLGWASPDRPAVQGEPVVNPGEVAVFGFQVQGVGSPGKYSLHLRPVIDGVAWLEDDGVFLDIEVVQPHHSRWVGQSAYSTITVGETTSLWVKFLNVGTSTWRKGTGTEVRLGLNLDDRTISSLGMAVGWPFADRPAIQTEASVEPGEVATFTFQVRGARAGNYALHLRPVIDGVTWMEDEGVFQYITVR